MILFGTVVNALLIIIGSVIGLFFTRIPEKYKETVMQGIALAVLLIGLQMALPTNNLVLILIALLFGAIIGEFLQVEERMNRLGMWMGSKVTSKDDATTVAQGFITATMIFCVGAMAIIGALDSGIRGDHEVLITKGIIDGFTALVLTTTLGYGVVFSIIPLIVYQSLITLFATQIEKWIPEAVLNGLIVEVTAVGGLLIFAIGLNILKITQIRVANLMMAIIVIVPLFYIYQMI